MHLDVLCVAELTNARAKSRWCPPFTLQQHTHDIAQALALQQQRQGCRPCGPCCGSGKAVRYAADGHALFAAVDQAAAALVLQSSDDANGAQSVQACHVKGYVHAPPVLPVPQQWPTDELLGKGLPPTFNPEEGSSTTSYTAIGSSASEQVLHIAFAAWSAACPGKLVIATTTWLWGHGEAQESLVWQWHVLLISAGLQYVGKAVQASGRVVQQPALDTSERPPQLASVTLSWHPQGAVLAAALLTAKGDSGLAVLHSGSMETLWHRPWQPRAATSTSGVQVHHSDATSVCGLAWMPGSSNVLAAVDSTGLVCFFDVNGSPCLPQLGHELPDSKAGFVGLSASDVFANHAPIASATKQPKSKGRLQGCLCYSIAISPPCPDLHAAASSGTSNTPHAPTTPREGELVALLAVCDGQRVAVLAVSAAMGGSSVLAHQHRRGSGTPMVGRRESVDRDAVGALPGRSNVNLELLDNAPSFGSSTVSTPYMLGLQPLSSSFVNASTPLATSRSNLTDAYPPAPWPLAWRSVLNMALPGPQLPPGAAHRSSAVGPRGLDMVSVTSGAPTAVHFTSRAMSMGIPSPPATPRSVVTGQCQPAHSRLEAGSLAHGSGPVGTGGGNLLHLGVGGGSSAPAGAAHGADSSLVCWSAVALRALQRGDVLVLRGRMSEALHHYPHAHVYGFLPALLVLVHMHCIEGAASLLRAFGRYTGQVAAVAAAARSAAAHGPGPDAQPVDIAGGVADAGTRPPSDSSSRDSVGALQQQWQATMVSILDSAMAAASAHTPTHVSMSWGAPLDRTSAPATGSYSPPQGNSGLGYSPGSKQKALAAAELAQAEPGSPQQPVRLRLPASRFRDPAAQPVEEIDHSRRGSGDWRSGSPTAVRSASPTATRAGRYNAAPVLQERSSTPIVGTSGALAANGPLKPNATDASGRLHASAGAVQQSTHHSDERLPTVQHHTLRPGLDAQPQKPLQGQPAGQAAAEDGPEALQDLLSVCLQLLHLACQCMAFAAFSGHIAARTASSVTAGGAGAPEGAQLPMSPSSPRSPGNSLLSRQAMRRLSSTARMRSMKGRNSLYGATSVTGNAANAIFTGSGSVVVAGGGSITDQQTTQRPVSVIGAPATATAATGRTAEAPAMIIGFPVPVVWQPLPAQQLQQYAASKAAHGPSSFGSAEAAALASQLPSSAPGSPAGSTPMAGADGSSSCTPMRLQLHHCAFDVTHMWRDASLQPVSTNPGVSSASMFLKPAYAAGLLLMSHVCTVHQAGRMTSSDTASGQPPPLVSALGAAHGPTAQLQAPGRATRVNWQLLHTSAAATNAAALWQELSDWHRAALLAFACANTLQQLGAGSQDLSPTSPKKRRKSILASLPPAPAELPVGQSPVTSPSGTEAQLQLGNGVQGTAASRPLDSALAAARAACLRMGQRVLISQVAACQKMEVQDACGSLLELVALPRRLLGLDSVVHISLLQRVCTRMVDLLPKRVCITPLLPAGTCAPLLQLSHAGIRSQLVTHTGIALARVLEELRLAAACTCSFMALRDLVQQLIEHSTVDSCLRMLLRWQGTYDGQVVDQAVAKLQDVVQDMMLLPDTSDWQADSLLPQLEDAFITSGLLTKPDASGIIKAALCASGQAPTGGGVQQLGVVGQRTPPDGSVVSSSLGDSLGDQLQDLDELALMLDLAQMQHTLLASLQPFLHSTLASLRQQPHMRPPSGSIHATPSGDDAGAAQPHQHDGAATAAAPSSIAAETAAEDADHQLLDSMLEDPGVVSSMLPPALAHACVTFLLKLEWALHCRAQVCSHMLRLGAAKAAQSVASPTAAASGEAGTAPGAFTAADAGSTAPAASPAAPNPAGAIPAASARSFTQYVQHLAVAIAPQAAPSGLGLGSSGTPAGSEPDPQAEARQQLEVALVAWTAALVQVDVFHAGAELQGCALLVLQMVNWCPLDVATALDQALRRRSLFNSRLAEQVNRLKRSSQPQPVQHLLTGHRGGMATGGSMTSAAGLLTPTPSIDSPFMVLQPPPGLSHAHPVSPSLPSVNESPIGRVASHVPGGMAAPPSSLVSSMASLPRLQSLDARAGAPPSGAVGRCGSMPPGVSPLGRGLPPATSFSGSGVAPDEGGAAAGPPFLPHPGMQRPPPIMTPTTPTGPGGHTPMSMREAVAAAQRVFRQRTLTLLDHYADPSGALPSGLSHAANVAGNSSFKFKAPPAETTVADAGTPQATPSGSRAGLPPAPPLAGMRAASRSSRALSSNPNPRSQLHASLLQCLVAELVRSAHSVSSTVSWRATLEGGRGLGGCFQQPLLHGDPSAKLVGPAHSSSSSGGGGAPVRLRPSHGLDPEGVRADEAARMSADESQALLLSLMDITKWCDVSGGGVVAANAPAPPSLQNPPAGIDPLTAARTQQHRGSRAGIEGGSQPVAIGMPATIAAAAAAIHVASMGSLAGSDASLTPVGSPRIAAQRATQTDVPSLTASQSLVQHNNPAYGLYSPSPSNLSEMWDDANAMTSELPSPSSCLSPDPRFDVGQDGLGRPPSGSREGPASSGGGAAADRAPSPASGSGVNRLWTRAQQQQQAAPGAAAAQRGPSGSWSGAHPASDEDAAKAVQASRHNSTEPMALGYLPTVPETAASSTPQLLTDAEDEPPVPATDPASPTAADQTTRPEAAHSLTVDEPSTSNDTLEPESIELQLPANGPLSPGAASPAAAVHGRLSGRASLDDAALTPTAAHGANRRVSISSAAESDPPPTLSYLLDMNVLAAIRGAVKEAHGEAAPAAAAAAAAPPAMVTSPRGVLHGPGAGSSPTVAGGSPASPDIGSPKQLAASAAGPSMPTSSAQQPDLLTATSAATGTLVVVDGLLQRGGPEALHAPHGSHAAPRAHPGGQQWPSRQDSQGASDVHSELSVVPFLIDPNHHMLQPEQHGPMLSPPRRHAASSMPPPKTPAEAASNGSPQFARSSSAGHNDVGTPSALQPAAVQPPSLAVAAGRVLSAEHARCAPAPRPGAAAAAAAAVGSLPPRSPNAAAGAAGPGGASPTRSGPLTVTAALMLAHHGGLPFGSPGSGVSSAGGSMLGSPAVAPASVAATDSPTHTIDSGVTFSLGFAPGPPANARGHSEDGGGSTSGSGSPLVLAGARGRGHAAARLKVDGPTSPLLAPTSPAASGGALQGHKQHGQADGPGLQAQMPTDRQGEELPQQQKVDTPARPLSEAGPSSVAPSSAARPPMHPGPGPQLPPTSPLALLQQPLRTASPLRAASPPQHRAPQSGKRSMRGSSSFGSLGDFFRAVETSSRGSAAASADSTPRASAVGIGGEPPLAAAHAATALFSDPAGGAAGAAGQAVQRPLAAALALDVSSVVQLGHVPAADPPAGAALQPEAAAPDAAVGAGSMQEPRAAAGHAGAPLADAIAFASPGVQGISVPSGSAQPLAESALKATVLPAADARPRNGDVQVGEVPASLHTPLPRPAPSAFKGSAAAGNGVGAASPTPRRSLDSSPAVKHHPQPAKPAVTSHSHPLGSPAGAGRGPGPGAATGAASAQRRTAAASANVSRIPVPASSGARWSFSEGGSAAAAMAYSSPRTATTPAASAHGDGAAAGGSPSVAVRSSHAGAGAAGVRARSGGSGVLHHSAAATGGQGRLRNSSTEPLQSHAHHAGAGVGHGRPDSPRVNNQASANAATGGGVGTPRGAAAGPGARRGSAGAGPGLHVMNSPGSQTSSRAWH